ncbi:MAG: hypothetical protein IKT57_08865 [Clostridia bacterium]|nr:hypothetical protein [Clostridia bacterium]
MKKISHGRFFSFLGTLIISIGLFCNGLELISITAFRIIAFAGILVHVMALVFALKKKEF